MEDLKAEDDESMDFETGIDIWIINKNEMLNKRQVESSKPVSSGIKVMNKENIKTRKSPTNKQPLRCFRIRKTVNYQELSSDSDGDSRKNINDLLNPEKFDPTSVALSFCSKRKSPVVNVKDKKRYSERLSSEEIALVLTEGNISDTVQEKSRETLLSIENVDPADKNRDLLVSSRSIFSCIACTYSCNILEELTSHEGTQHSEIFNESKIACRSGFFKSGKNHVISEQSSRLNGICNQSTNKALALRHVSGSKVSGKYTKKNYFCHICNSSFQEQLTLKTHQILFHSEKKILECEYCDYKTSQCSNLATHIRVHFLLNCPYCNFHSSFKTSFNNHLLTHDKNRVAYKCKKCPYENRSKFLFQKHIKTHENSREYKCDECDKSYGSKKVLKFHQRKHNSKEKLHKCAYCSHSFSGKQSLMNHEKCHERMHECGICNLCFTKRSQLRTHKKVHSVETFICSKCGLNFQRKYLLIRHMSEHEPDVSKCEHCSLTFFSINDFLKHDCIIKLYNVQKRPLNFKNISKKGASRKETVDQIGKQTKSTDEKKSKHKPTVKINETHAKYKEEDNKLRVLSRCKNRCKSKRISENRPNKSRKGCNQNSSVKKEKKQKELGLLIEETKPESRLRKKHSNSQQTVFPAAKKSKKKESAKLDVAKILFGKKPTSEAEVTLCSCERFLPCFKQNHAIENHLVSQLNRNDLRSCGKCVFKTNNNQILEDHLKHAHTWSAEIIKSLFK